MQPFYNDKAICFKPIEKAIAAINAVINMGKFLLVVLPIDYCGKTMRFLLPAFIHKQLQIAR